MIMSEMLEIAQYEEHQSHSLIDRAQSRNVPLVFFYCIPLRIVSVLAKSAGLYLVSSVRTGFKERLVEHVLLHPN